MLVCPACRAGWRDPAADPPAPRPLEASQFGSSRRAAESQKIAVCRTCGLGWQVDPPSTKDLAATYEAMRDEIYLAEADNRRRAFERLARLVRRYAGHGDGALMDVGCSAGLFLEIATRHGWEAWGVEPSRWLSERAKEVVGSDRVFAATLETAPLEDKRFDVVTMWDVLEHVREPESMLRVARSALRPSGLLFLNVPARDSLVARVLGRRWPLLLPEHLVYFSRQSLRILLERSGFEVLGFHQHLVFFSASYVFGRLAQHDWPVPGPILRALGSVPVRLPLLMGEITVVARALGASGGDTI